MWLLPNHPRIISETLDDEIIAINMRSGAYYSLRGLGACIWSRLSAGTATDDLVGELEDHYREIQVASPVNEFLARLAAEDLVREVQPDVAATASDVPLLPLPELFEPPDFERFTDMENLLLLDPVHEIDERGWPHRA